MTNTVSGGCICGDFTYQFDRDQVVSAHHCHCRDCQKTTGSGKATIVLIPADILQSDGELKTYTVVGTDGSHVTRGFCPNCGSQLISYVEEMPGLRFVKAGSLDDSSWVKVDSSFWSSTAEDWSPVDDRCPSVEKNPGAL